MIVVLQSCYSKIMQGTMGEDFDAAKIEQIEKYKSTKEDILKLFGEPFSKSTMMGKNELWIYYYYTSQITAKNKLTHSEVEAIGGRKMLNITFNEKDQVIYFTYTGGDSPKIKVTE